MAARKHNTPPREVLMAIPAQVKPAAWGAVGGAIAAMIIGFVWGGWVTGGTSERAAGAAARTAVEQNFVPLCVAKAEQQPDQLILLKNFSRGFVPPVAVETGVLAWPRRGGGRLLHGGDDPVKKHGPWAVAHLRVVTP